MAYYNNQPPSVHLHRDELGHEFWADTETLSLPGFLYYPNFVTREEEEKLLALVDQNEWYGGIGRRQQFFGYHYYHTTHDLASLQPEEQPQNIHDLSLLQSVLDRILDHFPQDHPPTQCLVNEYVNNRGISSHVDNPACFGDVVIGLSLGDPVYMTFVKHDHEGATPIATEAKVFLDRRSLMVMKGEARFHWRHGITAMKRIYNPLTEECVRRNTNTTYRRVSFTFREIKVEGTKQIKLPIRKNCSLH